MATPIVRERESLHDNGVMCMMPWVAIHVAMNGNAYPCCFADGSLAVGSVTENSISDIWNGAGMRALRQNMLRGRRSALCAKCYEQEESGFASLRTSANANYRHHWQVVRDSSDDGAVEPPNIVYLDIRFSNVCNFVCRTCGPIASTAWSRYGHIDGGPLLRPRSSPESLLEELVPFIGSIEQAYFAGGEPLLMHEHYAFLDMLLAHGREDVKLSYTTNFSVFECRRRNILDYWKSFKHVEVSASLDGSRERGEYLRKGQRWSTVLDNRRLQRERCPHVVFNVLSTLSLLNSLHLPDLHEELLHDGFVDAGHIFVNILQEPSHFRLTTLPGNLKALVSRRYEQHIARLAERPADETGIRAYESAVRFMYSQDTSEQLGRFRDVMRHQDGMRNECFRSTFPELDELMRP